MVHLAPVCMAMTPNDVIIEMDRLISRLILDRCTQIYIPIHTLYLLSYTLYLELVC